MRTSKSISLTLLFLLLAGSAPGALPADCSVSVGVTTRLGVFRTWTNALETQILEGKGYGVCQDDAILKLSEEEIGDLTAEEAERLLGCKTEFKLELLFRRDNMTRNVSIFRKGKIVFDRDYPANPSSIGSLKILKTIPTCEEVLNLVAKPGN